MARGTQVQVRLSSEEKAILVRRARESGLSVSEFIRVRALAGLVTPVGGPVAVPSVAGVGSPVGVRGDGPAAPVMPQAPSGKRSFAPDPK